MVCFCFWRRISVESLSLIWRAFFSHYLGKYLNICICHFCSSYYSFSNSNDRQWWITYLKLRLLFIYLHPLALCSSWVFCSFIIQLSSRTSVTNENSASISGNTALSLSTITKEAKMSYTKKYNLANDKNIKVNTPWVLSMITGSFSPPKERQFTDKKLYHLKNSIFLVQENFLGFSFRNTFFKTVTRTVLHTSKMYITENLYFLLQKMFSMP